MQLGDGLMRQRDDTGCWITGHCSHAGTGGCWSGLAELSHCSGDAPSSFPGERPRRAIHVDRPTSFSAKRCAGAVSGRVCFACVAIRCRGSSLLYFLQTRFTPVRGRRIPRTQIGARLIIHSAKESLLSISQLIRIVVGHLPLI